MSKRFSSYRSQSQEAGLTLVEVVVVVLVLVVLFTVLVPKAIQYRRDYTDSMKATQVYDAIHKSGTWRTIVSGSMGNSGIVTFPHGRLEGGIAVVLQYVDDATLQTTDATFWIKDDVIHAVNDTAHNLLPAAP
ncbi:MAG: hypothetical protein K1Y02_22405, partial [Candidatus Hydrogenedentes bacterium]|nr:hypothetical protein [Candidatus Hydrogenedentota bacterium]